MLVGVAAVLFAIAPSVQADPGCGRCRDAAKLASSLGWRFCPYCGAVVTVPATGTATPTEKPASPDTKPGTGPVVTKVALGPNGTPKSDPVAPADPSPKTNPPASTKVALGPNGTTNPVPVAKVPAGNPGPAPVGLVGSDPATEEDIAADVRLRFPGDRRLSDGVFRSKAAKFELSAPAASWQLVGDPKEILRLTGDLRAELAIVREGGLLGVVFVQPQPGLGLTEYALRVRPQGLLRGEEVPVTKPDGTADGKPFLRREYRTVVDGKETRLAQFITARGAVMAQVIVRVPVETLDKGVRAELEALQESFRFLGAEKKVEPAEDAFEGDTQLAGDVFRHKPLGFRLVRPGADWKFVTEADKLADWPEGTVVALEGPDGLSAALLVVKNDAKLPAFADSVAPDLGNRVAAARVTAEVDTRSALLAEYRGRCDGDVYQFVQMLVADGASVKYQLTVWGRHDLFEKHRAAALKLTAGLGFFVAKE